MGSERERCGRRLRDIGAEVEGFRDLSVLRGNTVLRAWISTPLTVGLFDRAHGTVEALFSPRLWTADGLATQAGEKTFWDQRRFMGCAVR